MNDDRDKPEDAGPFAAGDIVHYMLGGSHLIAIITAEVYPPDSGIGAEGPSIDPRFVDPDATIQALIVFPPMGAPFSALAPHDESIPSPDLTWHRIRTPMPPIAAPIEQE